MALPLYIPFHPRPAQRLIFSRLDLYRFVTAVCHRRLGKTVTGVNWLIEGAYDSPMDDYRGYYIAPTAKQAKTVTWSYFKKFLAEPKKKGLVNFNETELRIDFHDDRKIYLSSAEVIENLRGIYLDRLVSDELASWADPDYAYSEVLRPAMADRLGRALFIGTVKGLDKFHEFFSYGLDNNPLWAEWASVSLKASMTGILPPLELAKMKLEMAGRPGAYDREMENDWFAEVEDRLIRTADVMAAVERPFNRQVVLSSDIHIGVDPGRTGDPTAVVVRRGPAILEVLLWAEPNHMIVVNRIAQLIQRYSRSSGDVFVYIDAGMGAGIIDRLRALKYNNIVEVHFNMESPEPNCSNMRAAMYYRAGKWLLYGSIPRRESLVQELSNVLLAEPESNMVKLAPKKDIRKLLGRSPNEGDACALTFAEVDEYVPPNERMKEILRNAGISTIDMEASYDPMAYMEQRYAGGSPQPSGDPYQEYEYETAYAPTWGYGPED